MITEEYRRLGILVDALDVIDFHFSNLKMNYETIIKNINTHTRQDLRILQKNVESSIKTGRNIAYKLLEEAGEMQMDLDRKKKMIELSGSLLTFERLENAIRQQKQECLDEINKTGERLRKRNARKKPSVVSK